MTPSQSGKEQEQGSSTPAFPIQGELSIYEAANLNTELLAALRDNEALAVDLSGVTVLDGAGLQLLISLKREASRHGKLVSFTGHSEAVLKVLDLTDLAGSFGDTLVLPAEKAH